MRHLTRLPFESDLEWQLRISNIVIAQEKLIATQRQEIDLLRGSHRASFDLSADIPSFFKRQIGPTS